MPRYKTNFGWMELFQTPKNGDLLKVSYTDPSGHSFFVDFMVVEVIGEELVLGHPSMVVGRILTDAPLSPDSMDVAKFSWEVRKR